MRKFLLFLALIATTTINAQIATENSKLFDNTYVTLQGGVSTPLNFKNIFPINPSFGLAIGKQLTPIFGIEAEGTTWLGSHIEVPMKGFNEYPFTVKRFGQNENGNFNAFRGVYVGMNGIINLTNLFLGYNGTPRTFELAAVAGTGWEHIFSPNEKDSGKNGLGVKTGLDFNFNLGKAKAHTISFKPAVLWNVMTFGDMPLQFNKNYAQLYIGLGYTYHFKTSNGTHNFKTYDVGAMINEISRLNEELAKKPKEVIVNHTITQTNSVYITDKTVVYFAFDDATLNTESEDVLNRISSNGVYNVFGYASSEGTNEYNMELSKKRAEVVAEYLRTHGIKVGIVEGRGVQFGATTNRVVEIIPLKD